MDNQTRNPLVSVIIPVYNGEKTLATAITSVVCQGIAVEIIIVDNASTDGTSEVIAYCRHKWAMAPVKWKIIHCIRNLGVAAARNLGVKKSSAPYVAFLDSDDWWAEDKLRKQLELLYRTKGVISSTAREFATAEGKLTGYVIPVKPTITYQDLLRENVINCSSVMLAADVAKEFPMVHDEFHEDYITWLQILKKYKLAYAINEPLLKYRYWKGSKSSNKWKSMAMHYNSLRCVGIHPGKALWYCGFYAFAGIRKYWRLKRRITEVKC